MVNIASLTPEPLPLGAYFTGTRSIRIMTSEDVTPKPFFRPLTCHCITVPLSILPGPDQPDKPNDHMNQIPGIGGSPLKVI